MSSLTLSDHRQSGSITLGAATLAAALTLAAAVSAGSLVTPFTIAAPEPEPSEPGLWPVGYGTSAYAATTFGA